MLVKSIVRAGLGAGIIFCFAGLATQAFAGAAPVQGITCAIAQNIGVPGGASISIQAAAGDVIRITQGVNDNTGIAFTVNNIPSGPVLGTDVATIPANVDGPVTISAGLQAIVFSCTPAGSGAGASTGNQTAVNTSAATVAGSGQSDAIGWSVTNDANVQFGQGGNAATRDRVFMSSQGLPRNQPIFGNADWNAWISAERRDYSGGNDGDSFDIVAGAGNRLNNDLIIGGLLAYGQSDFVIAGQRVEITSPALGLYMAQRFGDRLRLDLSFALARPEYRVTGGNFTANRQSLTLSLRGAQAIGVINLEPFANLTAFREDQPSYSTTTATVSHNEIDFARLSMGAQIAPLVPYRNGILPYLSLAADFNHRETTFGGNSTLWSPRVGLGMRMAFAQGSFSLDFDAGELLDHTDDYGLKFAFVWDF